MPLQISDFVNAAGKGDSQVLEVREPNRLKSSGFLGRTFGSAGKDEATNQATMRAFVDSVRREKGGLMANVVRARLTELTDGGRPLTGRMVKAVMQEMTLLRGEAKKVNEQFFQRLIYDQGPGGLQALVNAGLPPGARLAPKDLETFANMLRFRMEACTQNGRTMTLDDVRDVLSPYQDNLARLTPEALARLDDFVDHHQDYHLTRPQAETLRSLMLTNGVTSEVMIDQTAELFHRCLEAIPRIAASRTGGDLAAAYDGLCQSIHEVFPPDQPVDGPMPSEHSIPAAIQAALLCGGYTPDRLMDLYANVVMGQPGSELSCSCGIVNTQGDALDRARILPLTGMQQTFSSTVGLMLGVFETGLDIPGSRARFTDSYDRMDEIPRGMAQYLRAMGCGIPPALYSDPRQSITPLLDFSAGKGTVSAGDWYRLLQSLGSRAEPGNWCETGLGAMFEALPRLKEAEPGSGPFSPQAVWRAVFDEPLPPGVTPDNLSDAVGAEINARLQARFGPEVAEHQGVNVMIAVSTLGVPWRRAFEMLATPGEIRFTDLPVPPAFTLSGPPTWELERATIAKMTLDVHRRGGYSTLTIGGHEALRLNQPVPSPEAMETAMRDMTQEEKDAYLEHVEQLKNYHHESLPREDRGLYNFMADAILTQLTELTGTSEAMRAQRIGVLEALSQTTSGMFRLLSPLAGGFGPGRELYEHSAFNTTVTRDGDLIKVRLETPPNAPLHGLLEYSVDRRGTITMTDMSLGQTA